MPMVLMLTKMMLMMMMTRMLLWMQILIPEIEIGKVI